MQSNFEKTADDVLKLTMEFSHEELNSALNKAYLKKRSQFAIPGFRKGKVPRAVLEKYYGNLFFEDALELLVNEHFYEQFSLSGEELGGRPNIVSADVTEDGGLVAVINTPIVPEVKLCEYEGLSIRAPKTEVTDAMVDQQIQMELRKQTSRQNVTDRPAKDGDLVTISYTATIDGEPYDDAKADNRVMRVGVKTMYPEVDAALVGIEAGEVKDIDVKIPETVSNKEAAGKTAVFHLTAHAITEEIVPELDDDFVQDISEFDTVDEYRADVRKNLEIEVAARDREELENRVLNLISSDSVVIIPDQLIQDEVDALRKANEAQYRMQGIELETLFTQFGLDREAFEKDLRAEAENRVRMQLVVRQLVKAEDIKLEDGDVEKEMERYREVLGNRYDEWKNNLKPEEMNRLANDAVYRKLLDKVISKFDVETEPLEAAETEEAADESYTVSDASEPAAPDSGDAAPEEAGKE